MFSCSIVNTAGHELRVSIDGIPLDDRPQLLVVSDVVENSRGAHHEVW